LRSGSGGSPASRLGTIVGKSTKPLQFVRRLPLTMHFAIRPHAGARRTAGSNRLGPASAWVQKGEWKVNRIDGHGLFGPRLELAGDCWPSRLRSWAKERMILKASLENLRKLNLGGSPSLIQMFGRMSKYSSSSFLPPSPLPMVFSVSTNSMRSIHFTIL